MKVRVITPSRIHVTLIDLNGSIGRVDGGVGFALESPKMIVEVSDEKSETGNSRAGLALRKMEERFGFKASVEVIESYRPHCGLGSGTQLSLAVAKAYCELFGIDVSVRELAEIVGRGGTSGIGVATFETGGFIVDGGHSRKVKPDFAPSSASKAPPPPVLARHDFPWKVAVLIPEVSGFSGIREVNLFEKNCPIKLDDVKDVCHTVLMKMLPAVVEKDIDSFRESVSRIQKVGFKRIEVSMYSRLGIPELLEEFEGAGMSSTGTAIYYAVKSDSEGKKFLKEVEEFFADRGINCEALVSNPNNTGAKVVHEV